MDTFEWEDGTVVERPYVLINGQKYYVQDGSVSGGTPVSSNNLNEMQNIINDNIEEKVDGRNYIAWRNSNPTQSFSAQQVMFNKSMNGASHYEILFLQSTTTARIMTSGKIPYGHGTILEFIHNFRATNAVVGDTSITFEDAYDNSTGSNVMDNSKVIPYMVLFHYDNIW